MKKTKPTCFQVNLTGFRENSKTNATFVKSDFEGNFISGRRDIKSGEVISYNHHVKITDDEWEKLCSFYEVDETTGYDYWDNEIDAFITRTLHNHLKDLRNGTFYDEPPKT